MLKFKSEYPEQLFSQKQLREMLGGKSDMSIWRLRSKGTIPQPIKFNGRNFWTRSQLVVFFSNLDAANDNCPSKK